VKTGQTFSCNSTYEAKRFSAVFVLAFRAFLRIGETVESGKSSHVIQQRDVILNHTDKSVSILIITQNFQCRFKNNNYLISSNLLVIEMTKE
jgi:hypothetical protein